MRLTTIELLTKIFEKNKNFFIKIINKYPRHKRGKSIFKGVSRVFKFKNNAYN